MIIHKLSSGKTEIYGEYGKLYLAKGGIKNIDCLSGMADLEELVLYGNEIEDVSPLSGLTNLTELELWDNPIKDTTPLENLTGTKIRLE